MAALDAATADGVRALAADAAGADGVAPLSEQALLHLPANGDGVSHLLVRPDGGGDPVAYAQLDVSPAADGEPAVAELLVAPALRRTGLGTALARELLDRAPGGRLRAWAHGDLPAATGLARTLGFVRVRALWRMERSLDDPLPAPSYPPGVTVRTFEPGRDETAWLEVNGAAFAHHPEQGRWTGADVRAREQAPWFDPAGFFLAERRGRLVGFHWTKVEGPPPAGEVYVVGVDPAESGHGLGPALTLTGLHHLRDRGLDRVLLYVDEDNAPAVRIYTRLGFRRVDVDVSYERGGTG